MKNQLDKKNNQSKLINSFGKLILRTSIKEIKKQLKPGGLLYQVIKN